MAFGVIPTMGVEEVGGVTQGKLTKDFNKLCCSCWGEQLKKVKGGTKDSWLKT